MGSGVLLSGVAAACSVGMGCGTCCGSGISAFLAGYMMTHAHNFREALGGFLKFYLGKILAVVSICLMTSLAGSRLLSDEGYLGRVPLAKVIDLCMIAVAFWMLYDLLLEKSGRKTCAHCSRAGAEEETNTVMRTPDTQNSEKKSMSLSLLKLKKEKKLKLSFQTLSQWQPNQERYTNEYGNIEKTKSFFRLFLWKFDRV